MFVQHKQLKVLNVPAAKVARLNTSSGSVQMAFPDYPPQMCGAYLVSLASGNKVLVVVAFYLTESCQSIFFVPKAGEVPVEDAEETFDSGFVFAESMGFVLSETDYHLLASTEQQKLWSSLPICRHATAQSADKSTEPSAELKSTSPQDSLAEHRERSLKSLGRFLSSL